MISSFLFFFAFLIRVLPLSPMCVRMSCVMVVNYAQVE
jgi:hypothetical protein